MSFCFRYLIMEWFRGYQLILLYRVMAHRPIANVSEDYMLKKVNSFQLLLCSFLSLARHRAYHKWWV